MLDIALFAAGLGLVLWGLCLGDRAAHLRPDEALQPFGCLPEAVLCSGGLALMAAAALVAGKIGGL